LWAVHVATTTPKGHAHAGDHAELLPDSFTASLEAANHHARAVFAARCPSHYAGARTLTVTITQPDGSAFASGPTPVGGRVTVKAVRTTAALLGACPTASLQRCVWALAGVVWQHLGPGRTAAVATALNDPRLLPLLCPDPAPAHASGNHVDVLATYRHGDLVEIATVMLRQGQQALLYMVPSS